MHTGQKPRGMARTFQPERVAIGPDKFMISAKELTYL